MLLPGIVNKSVSDRYRDSAAITNYLMSLALMVAAVVMLFIYSRKAFSQSNELLISEDEALIVGASFFSLCAGGVWLVCSFIYFNWAGDDRNLIFSALVSRDRRGTRLPGDPLAKYALRKLSAEQISQLPDSHLLALIASGKFHPDEFINVVLRRQPPIAVSSGPETLARHPKCTPLVLVDFLTGWDADYRAAATTAAVPPLWPRALNELLYSRHPEARVGATRCPNLPRQDLLSFAISDSDPQVRRSACGQIRESITAVEAMSLSRSSYHEIRSAAINSRLLPRDQLVALCKSDPDASTRLLAWGELAPSLTAKDAIELSAALHIDVIAMVIGADVLPRETVLKLCLIRSEANLRRAAWARLEPRLTTEEAIYLSRSQFEEVRRYALTSGKLPRSSLIKMCVIDPSRPIRREILRLIEKDLNQSEATLLMNSPDVEARLFAAQSGLLERRSLIRCCLRDDSERVYRAAWERIRNRLTASEALSLLISKNEEVRRGVVRSELLARSDLINCCRYDASKMVRAAAWQIARSKLTRTEALLLSSSNHGEVRKWAVASRLLPLSRRFWLVMKSLFE